MARETARFQRDWESYSKRQELVDNVRQAKSIVCRSSATSATCSQLVQYLADDLMATPSPLQAGPRPVIVCSVRHACVAKAMARRVATEWAGPGAHAALAQDQPAVTFRTSNTDRLGEGCRIAFTSHAQLLRDLVAKRTDAYTAIVVHDADDGALETDRMLGMLRVRLRETDTTHACLMVRNETSVGHMCRYFLRCASMVAPQGHRFEVKVEHTTKRPTDLVQAVVNRVMEVRLHARVCVCKGVVGLLTACPWLCGVPGLVARSTFKAKGPLLAAQSCVSCRALAMRRWQPCNWEWRCGKSARRTLRAEAGLEWPVRWPLLTFACATRSWMWRSWRGALALVTVA